MGPIIHQGIMKKRQTAEIPAPGDQGIKLSRLLKFYEHSDFATQQKARFIFYLCLYAISAIIIIIFSTIYIQINDYEHNGIYLPALLPEIAILVLFFVCLRLLIRGFYGASAHLGIVSGMICVWLTMWLDKASPIARLDTIVIVVALMNLAPLFITRYKSTIIFYISTNIGILIAFLFYYHDQMGLSHAVVIDYFIDTSLAMIFTGIVGYSIFNINNRVLNKALAEIKVREQTEKALSISEKKFRELTELLPQTIFESDLKGNITYVNKSGFKMFGYDDQDLRKGINLTSLISPEYHDIVKRNMDYIIKGQTIHGTQYTAIKKDSTCINIQSYTTLIEEDQRPVGLRGIIVDITESKKAEEELKQSRDQFQSLVSNIPGVTYRCLNDYDSTMLYISSEIERLSGYKSSDFVKNQVRTFRSIVFEDDLGYISSLFNKAIQKGKPWELEYRVHHRDGSIRWVSEKGRAVFDSGGKLMFLDGFILDITARKLAEEALRESESLMAELLNGIPLPTFMLDSDGTFLYLNKAFAGDYGKSVHDLLGKKALALLPSELAEKRKTFIDKVFMDGKPFFFDDSNQGIHYTNYIYPILDNEGRAKHVVIFALDVTKRKQSEKKLLESEERYRKLIEAIPDIIMLSDLNGNILYGNPPLEIITGIGLKDYNNPERAAHIHPEDLKMVSEAIKDLIIYDKANTEVIENRFIDSWGKMHWFSGRIAKLTINGQIVLQTVSRDITEKKLIERELENHRNNLELLVKERTEELAATNEELTATNEELLNQREELQTALNKLNEAQKQLIQSEKMASLGLLSAGIAHEINNPLNFIHGGILGIEEYIRDNLQEHLDHMNPLINAIHVGVKRSSEIVSSLNHYSRQDDLPQGDCDVHDIIDNCLVMLQNQLKNKVEIKKQYTEKHCHTIGNEGKLHQAILNILANAAQAIEDKGTIRIQTKVLKDSVHISIADSGCGISQKNLARIFDPFFTTKAPGKGTGLGLSITYRIIQEHNGSIDYESQPDKGTTATIKLPAKQA
jgi:PAS domain S-box-containing protein